MSLFKNIIDNLKNQGIITDDSQSKLISKLSEYEQDNASPIYFFKSKRKQGFYVWGDVGRGKTLIMMTFLNLIKNRKGIFHYIDFMNYIHENLNIKKGIRDPLLKISKDLQKKYELIFIDEFQIEDVADAMIIGNLLNDLINNKVKVYISSNSEPKNLYKDGLQREKFIQSMNIVKNKLIVYELEGNLDYRMMNFYQDDTKKNNKNIGEDEIKTFIAKNFQNGFKSIDSFEINSRIFPCKSLGNNYIWISFKDFFSKPNGSKEYIKICKNYEYILINEFFECDDSNTSIIRRFISFIDIAYKDSQKIKFFIKDIENNKIYTGKKLNYLWERCESRIKEMNTAEYYNNL